MKKNVRIMAAVLASAAVIASLAGCGKKAGTPAATTAAAQAAAAQAAAPAATEAPTEAPAKEVDWPKRTITIKTSAAGGDMDYISRYLAQRMTEDWGVNVVVTNSDDSPTVLRGVIGAAADGYTIWCGKTSISIEAAKGSLEDISIRDQIDIIGNMVDNPALCVTVKPALGVKNINELIALTQSKPDELLITDNIGSNTWVTNQLLEKKGLLATEVDVGGTSKKMTAFLGDQCDIMICSYPSQREYVEKGDFVCLGQVSENRNPLYPDVPTLREQGVDVVFDTSLYMGMKKGTDPAIEEKFHDWLKNIVENDEKFANDVAEAQLMVPAWREGDAVQDILESQVEAVKEMLK